MRQWTHLGPTFLNEKFHHTEMLAPKAGLSLRPWVTGATLEQLLKFVELIFLLFKIIRIIAPSTTQLEWTLNKQEQFSLV